MTSGTANRRNWGTVPADEERPICAAATRDARLRELRLQIDGHGLQMSSVVRSAGEMTKTADEWCEAMIERGWVE